MIYLKSILHSYQNKGHQKHREIEIPHPISRSSHQIESPNAFSSLPQELILKIFSYLDDCDLTRCSRVSREWRLCTSDRILWQQAKPRMAFSCKDWAIYFGECEVAPPLPPNIHQILNSPCPFWPHKKVRETHLLVFIPRNIEGKPLTLAVLQDIVKKPKERPAMQFNYMDFFVIDKHGQQPNLTPHWVLMTREVIPGSRDKSYADQQALLTKFNTDAQVGYVVPSALEIVICLFAHYAKTQERLLGDKPWTNARCKEKVMDWQVVVGCFSSAGLHVNFSRFDNYGLGLTPVRQFFLSH